MAKKTHVRWMVRRDMPEVLDIERASFEFPWFEEDFIRCLRQRNCIGMVAEHAEHVVGFMIYELHKTRLQLLTLAVHPEFRLEGIGSLMLDKLKNKLDSHRRTGIATEIRERNTAAHFFFKANRFMATSILRNFYDDTDEDAYLFRYKLDPEDCNRARSEFGLMSLEM